MKMKSLFATLALVLVAGAATPAHAAVGTLFGTVHGFQFNPGSTYGILYLTPGPNQDTSTGSCTQPPAAQKMFKIHFGSDGDRERQILTSALLSGKTVQVNWNDAIKDGGYCIIQGLLLFQTAP